MRLLFIFLITTVFSWHSPALQCQKLLHSNAALDDTNFASKVKYFQYKGDHIPFIDLKPRSKEKGSVLLIQGFSQTMEYWINHANIFLEQGYRVISFDPSNVGANLDKNGIKDIDFGEGFAVDTGIGHAVIKKTNPKNLTIVGYSRGGRVASELAAHLQTQKNNPLKKLLLASPYSGYLWASSNPWWLGGDPILRTLEDDPGRLGSSVYEMVKKITKHSNKNEAELALFAQAYGYILKGTHPKDLENQITTLPSVKELVKQGVPVKVVSAEHETYFTPPETLKELDIEGVDFEVLKGDYEHSWPRLFPELIIDHVIN